MTFNNVMWAIESLVYLVAIVVIAFTLRGIRREIKRVADRMEEPK